MKPVWIVLHGAIGAEDQLLPLKKHLEVDCDVHVITFSGHGKKAHEMVDFSIELFAQDVISYLQALSLTQVNIFGYSMGGYVAMYLASRRPELVGRIITLGTKFEWNEAISAREVRMLDPEKIEAKIPAFSAVLAQRHSKDHWKTVLHKTQLLLANLGEDNPLKFDDFSKIQHEVSILWAENDSMVSREEGELVARALMNGKFAVLSHSEHPIEKVDLAQITFHIN